MDPEAVPLFLLPTIHPLSPRWISSKYALLHDLAPDDSHCSSDQSFCRSLRPLRLKVFLRASVVKIGFAELCYIFAEGASHAWTELWRAAGLQRGRKQSLARLLCATSGRAGPALRHRADQNR